MMYTYTLSVTKRLKYNHMKSGSRVGANGTA